MKIKENGLREGHPEKNGVDVKLADLVQEVRTRLRRKIELDRITQQAEGLRVIGGIRGDEERKESEPPASEVLPADGQVSEAEKFEAKGDEVIEKIGAIPAS